MKKILIFCLATMLLLPAIALATGVGGSGNPYHVNTVYLGKRIALVAGTTIPWTKEEQRDSLDYALLCNAAATWAHPETTNCFDVSRMTCPQAAGVYGAVFLRCATADSVLVTPQVSQDRLYWISMADVSLVGTIDFDPIVEGTTAITTPIWKWMRFIVTNNEGGKAASAVSTAGVRIWFSYFEKD
ncbi:MAG: hypothetical protein AMJ46_14195 [Latescibacteria bacterium DG_63]|nr:MAG: hypothetical protein AMJ46_14195 [Latescibacteria bacterium DG_63]